MATLAGQRAQFTYALNQYNLSEDPQTRAKFAKTMAKYIAAAPANGFTVDEITQGQIYPSSEVNQYLNDPSADDDPGITAFLGLLQMYREDLTGAGVRARFPALHGTVGVGQPR